MANTKKKNLQVDSNFSSSSYSFYSSYSFFFSSEEEVDSLPPYSKHAHDGSNLKRPRSKPNLSPPPMKKPVKRPTEATADRDPKKSKTPGEEEGKKPVLFQRLWSEEDEVAVLQGMLDYKDKKGSDPMEDSNDFFEFIKSSVNANVDRKQVVDKIRRLKKRLKNSKTRKTFSPHETIIIQLCGKIWGQEVDANPISNTTTEKKTEAGKSSEEHSSVNFLGKASVAMGLDEAIVAAGLGLCSEDTKSEIETKWRKLHVEESNLFIKKLDLAREEMQMIIAALRSVSGGL